MGWFGFGQNESNPLGKLDPKVRDFLEKESPIKYAKPEALSSKPAAAPTQLPKQTQPDGEAERERLVPRESLYPDGRYAHLWKTYRSRGDVEAETKTDHEKLMDVLEAYKDRKAQIGRAAMENCAEEQVDWNMCMKRGDWKDRMTMCSAEVRKFERCFMTQSRLLKALGYLSNYDRNAAQEEEVQMHADKLFHRMLRQEAEIDKAKAEGRPVPTFEPLVPAQPVVPMEGLSVAKQKEWKEKLDKVPEEDRPAEEAAMKAELRATQELAARVAALEQNRKERREQGKETLGDRVAGVFGK